MFSRCAFMPTLIAAMAFAAVADAAPYYVAVDLGDTGNNYSRAFDLNDNGQVVGVTRSPAGEYHAFLYSGGVMTDLGTFGGNRSYAYGINNNGEVVGYARYYGFSTDYAFLYDGTMHDLGVLSGGSMSQAYGINDAGAVVGFSYVSGRSHGFLYTSSGGMDDLGSLGSDPPTQTSGNDINASGQITGSSNDGAGEIHAFIYEGGSMQDLDTLGGYISVGNAINDSGVVVGYSKLDSASGGYDRAIIYENDTMQDLGTLGGDDSLANDINNSGVIVGDADTDSATRAFVYTGGTMYDLNDRTSPSLNWTMTSAQGINASGQICGYGTLDGKTHGYLLTVALAGDADCDGDVDNTDLLNAFGNYTGSGGTGRDWFTADFDGDADVDNNDLLNAFGNYGDYLDTAGFDPTAMIALSADPNLADLLYDPATGNVKLDASEAAGDVITGFVLENAAGGDDFVTGVVNFPFTTFQEDSATEISNVDATFAGFSGVWDLGNIFVTGLDEASLSAWLTQASYVGTLGSGVQTFDFVIVPEPSTLMMLVCGSLGLLAYVWRRRK